MVRKTVIGVYGSMDLREPYFIDIYTENSTRMIELRINKTEANKLKDMLTRFIENKEV